MFESEHNLSVELIFLLLTDEQVPELYEEMIKAGCAPDDMAKDMLRSAQRFKARGPKPTKREMYHAKKELESRYYLYMNTNKRYENMQY